MLENLSSSSKNNNNLQYILGKKGGRVVWRIA